MTEPPTQVVEVVYVFFVDPDTTEPTLTFLGLLDKLIFLSTDGASVTSGKESGLISLFREEKEWVI